MSDPTLKLDPIKGCVPGDRAHTLEVLARIEVPKMPEGALSPERPPLNLALVIDRSGSMSGAPLREAKACAKRLVESLRDGDRIAVIAYDHKVEVVATSTDARHRAEILPAIDRIESRGMTDLHGGWLAGAEQVAANLSTRSVNRVILLSDGNQNQGVTDAQEIARQCAAMADKGVETSTYGLGLEFNEDLMAAMARQGNGTAYYGESAEDLAPNFEAEFGILSSTTGLSVEITLHPRAGVSAKVMNDYRSTDAGWQLPNLVAGAEVWALLELDLDRLPVSAARDLVDVRVAYRRPDGEPGRPVEATLALPVVSGEQHAAAPEDSRVRERLKELWAAKAQIEAKRAAREGRWGDVDDTLSGLRMMAGDNAYIGSVADTLADLSAQRDVQRFAKEATFAASSMSARYADPNEDVTTLDASLAFTRKRGRQGKAT